MNNSITATIFIAMIFAMGISTAYVFAPSPAPSPAVLFKTTQGGSEGGSETDSTVDPVGCRRCR